MSDATEGSAARDARRAHALQVPAIQLRVMSASDIPAGLRLTRASHWNQLARDWELFLALSPDGCRVAVEESGEVVGSVATVRYGSAFGWIAMVLVDPASRGNGIGARLLQAALDILDDVPTVRLDATPAGHRVYTRFGFVDEYTIHRMQRVAQPLAMDSPTVQQLLATLAQGPPVRRMEDRDLPQVFAQDEEVFGADRRTLLEVFRGQAPEYAWVCGDGRIDGYLFGRRGYSFQHLGPLVARDEATARRLLGACLTSSADRAFIVDVPARPHISEFLESLHFTLQRPFTRMYRGQPCRQERTDLVFAIAGPEFA
jgi:GNAT superfamily N-acetyltransferase